MARFPYGGFGGGEHDSDEPWTKLDSIREYLEDGEAIPPALARWLGEAIRQANGDAIALLIGLGLRKPQGRPTTAWDDPQAKAALERLWALVGDGVQDDKAIRQVQEEFMTGNGDDRFSRSTLQRWLADVRLAENEKWEGA